MIGRHIFSVLISHERHNEHEHSTAGSHLCARFLQRQHPLGEGIVLVIIAAGWYILDSAMASAPPPEYPPAVCLARQRSNERKQREKREREKLEREKKQHEYASRKPSGANALPPSLPVAVTRIVYKNTSKKAQLQRLWTKIWCLDFLVWKVSGMNMWSKHINHQFSSKCSTIMHEDTTLWLSRSLGEISWN